VIALLLDGIKQLLERGPGREVGVLLDVVLGNDHDGRLVNVVQNLHLLASPGQGVVVTLFLLPRR
jgi:hypothetical protein